MDGTTRRDDKNLLCDLLETLIGSEATITDDIPLDTIEDWFGYRDADLARELVAILAGDPDCPVEYSPGPQERVFLADLDESRNYLNTLRETPWDELNVDEGEALLE